MTLCCGGKVAQIQKREFRGWFQHSSPVWVTDKFTSERECRNNQCSSWKFT